MACSTVKFTFTFYQDLFPCPYLFIIYCQQTEK